MGAVKSNLRRSRRNLPSASVRWMAAGISLLVILVFVGAFWLWPQNNLLLSILSGVVIAGVIYFIAGQFIQVQSELLSLRSRIGEAEKAAAAVNRRAGAMIELSRKFVAAEDEHKVVKALLGTIVEVIDAVGASMVPLDERGQPLTAFSLGEIPAPLMDSWVEYLASPEIRHTCGICQQTGSLVHQCPLLEVPVFDHLSLTSPSSIYCLHLRRGEREYGILNLYLRPEQRLEKSHQEFLQTLLDETALVLESLQLQKHEVDILQQLRHHLDPQELQLEFLTNVQQTLKADFVVLHFKRDKQPRPGDLQVGDFPISGNMIIEGMVESVQNSGQPVLLGDVEGEEGSLQGVRSLVAAPLLISGEEAFGILLAGNTRPQKFSSRHLSLLRSFASQISLVVRNFELRAEIEINSIMGERSRLAREIHDGLAQTLGFLKLQAAQMENYLAAEDTRHLQKSLSTTYKILSEAYQDVRQAIDDLRIAPDIEGFGGWLAETSQEFSENSGLSVNLQGTALAESLPMEIQVQLIRIIQEALSNVRKHAAASQAWIECKQEGHDFLVEIRDDGVGFHPAEVSGVSRYGLQGMRERCDLIGADLQVISAPEEGTIIKVKVPVPIGEHIQ